MSIPVQVPASRALARSEQYTGSVSSDGLERLQSFGPRSIEAELYLRTDAARRGWLEGRISGVLRLQCQTCSADFDWTLAAPVSLILAMDEAEEARLMADYEPVLVSEDRLMLHQIVEDEILLALPMIPKCPPCENSGSASAETSLEPVEKPGPLAALKNLSLKGVTPARRK